MIGGRVVAGKPRQTVFDEARRTDLGGERIENAVEIDEQQRAFGPSFRAVAARYAPGGPGSAGGAADARLLAKIKGGGAGTWGSVPMPPQAQVADPDARKVVEWILGGAQ